MALHFREKATENRCFPEFEAVGRTTCLYFQISNSGVTSKVSVTAISKFWNVHGMTFSTFMINLWQKLKR